MNDPASHVIPEKAEGREALASGGRATAAHLLPSRGAAPAVCPRCSEFRARPQKCRPAEGQPCWGQWSHGGHLSVGRAAVCIPCATELSPAWWPQGLCFRSPPGLTVGKSFPSGGVSRLLSWGGMAVNILFFLITRCPRAYWGSKHCQLHCSQDP